MMALDSLMRDHVIQTVAASFPDVQAIYLFGTWDTEDMRDESDVDIALLLPHAQARAASDLQMSGLHDSLETLFGRDVDLVNLREVSTVFQKEILASDRRIYCADRYAADEFEMLAISYYQKLNEERAAMIEDARQTGVFYKQ